MVKFQLTGASGTHTEVCFFQEDKGKVIGFPSYNLDLVKKHGTEESKELLRKILEGEE